MKCFYHKSDFDGICSAAIIYNTFDVPVDSMIGVDYKDSVDFSVISPNEDVWVVDFSFSTEDMIKLNATANLIWIDHHKSAIEKMAGHEDIKGLRVVGQAGCELTWKYLSSVPMPVSVRLLGRYDVWDHSDPRTLPFQYGMRAQGRTTFDSPIWASLLSVNADIDLIIDLGAKVLAYEPDQNTMYARGMSFEVTFHGFRAIVINKSYTNSTIFKSVYDPEKHDIMIAFGIKPREYKYTLFCDKADIDVSAIAKTYGGGGHAGAAGFYTDELLVEFK